MNANEEEIVCPACFSTGETSGLPKPGTCFLNREKNVWHCFHCGASGAEKNLRSEAPIEKISTSFQFSLELLAAYQKELLLSERAKSYLSKRFGGLQITSNYFDLGFDPGRDRLVIPIFQNKKLIGVKLRLIEDSSHEPKYISEPGSQAGLYSLQCGEAKEVLFVEGELDAMSACLMGFEGLAIAVQSNTIGREAKLRIERALEPLGTLRKIFIAPDADNAGQTLIKAVQSLQINQSVVCTLETQDLGFKDLSELLEKKGIQGASEMFSQTLNASKTALEQQTVSVFERLPATAAYLRDPRSTSGIPTGIRLLDQKLGGGLMPHTLTALSAPAKTGKTTFLIDLIHRLIAAGSQVGFISLEMDPATHVIPSLLSIAAKKNVRKLGAEIDSFIQQIEKEKPYLNNLCFFDRYGVTPSEDISAWIRSQYETNQTKLFFLDHVGYSLKDIKDPGEHSKLSKSLRALTRELPIHIIAIVQPKSLQPGQKFATKNDLYGSVTWSQDLNQLLTLQYEAPNKSHLRLMDSHNPLAQPSEDAVLLFYNRETCCLSDTFDESD